MSYNIAIGTIKQAIQNSCVLGKNSPRIGSYGWIFFLLKLHLWLGK